MSGSRALPGRLKAAAAWLFVLPLLAGGVFPDVVKVQLAGLALLTLAAAVLGWVTGRAAVRAVVAVAVLAVIVLAYLACRVWPAFAGSASSYDGNAAGFVVTYGAVAVYAALLFSEETFGRVMWRGATLALWASVLTCALSRLSGHALWVNAAHGTLRMDGTMGEPSDWAPVLAMVLLLALRRRSWFYVCLSLAGLLLADSPVCLLVMAVSLPLYAALASTWRHRGLLLASLAVVIPAAVFFVLHANPQGMLDSPDPVVVTVGRLVSGVRNVQTDGQEGQNTRFANTSGVIDVVRDEGWMRAGAGPGAHVTYFAVMGPQEQGLAVSANAIWAMALFDFGEWGVAALGVLMAAAAWRVRRSPVMAAVLLPVFVASLVNSSIPCWSFTVLGIMLYGFGWGVPLLEVRDHQDVSLAAVAARA